MHIEERPREKAILQGMRNLSNRELIAILLRTGSKQYSALELADLVLHTKRDLVELLDLRMEEVMRISGIKSAKATQLLACFELCKRINLEQVRQTPMIEDENPIIADWLMQEIGHEKQEHFFVLFLDNRGKLLSYKDMFVGTCNKNFANPREIFQSALQSNCTRIICAHNHPSGNVHPSIADQHSATALESSGQLLGIKVIDHLIVSQRNYYSFREHGMMLDQKEQKALAEMLEPKKKKQVKACFPDH